MSLPRFAFVRVARQAPLRIGALRGWRAFALAFVCGAACVLAFAPFRFPVILLVALPILVWQLDGAAAESRRRTAKRAALVAWGFGAGFYGVGLHWIGNAFLVDIGEHAILLPFPILFLLLGLPLFVIAACVPARLWLWGSDHGRILALAALLALSDWMRGHIFTGFPWNLWGNAALGVLPLAQSASLVGVYGLSLAILLIAMLPAMFICGASDRQPSRTSWKILPAPLCLAAAAILASLWGAERLTAETQQETGITIRLVETNFSQREKQRRERLDDMADTLLRLSFFPDEGTADPPPRLIVWPEVALRAYLEEEHALRDNIAALMPDGSRLLAGSLRRERRYNEQGESEWRRYNSLLVFDSNGVLETRYDKRHLVPFGEYIPYARRLQNLGLGLRALTRIGFAAGETPRILSLDGIPPFAALICYEAIFSGAILPPNEPRPHWLVNISNDAWFGDSIGPWQHLDQARLRAIEEGLPLLRATNTGVSALIDPHGRIPAQATPNRHGILDVRLPAPLPPTFFSRHGDMPMLVASLLLLFFSAWSRMAANPSNRAERAPYA